MKTLYLLRHAKAAPGSAAMEDHERPLAEKGLHDAGLLGALLRDRGVAPSLVLCSTALRTRQTLAGLESGLGRSLQVQYEPGLYLAAPQHILTLLMGQPAETESLMVIGHNPSIHQFATELVETGKVHEIDELSTHFPTCALAECTLPIADWADISPRCATLRDFVIPGQIEA